MTLLDNSWLDAAAATARTGTFAVLTDVDGTISHLAPRPDLAEVSPRARSVLTSLASRIALVGIISGRPLAELRDLVALPDLFYSASHGLTSWYQGVERIEPAGLPYAELTGTVENELSSLLAPWPVRFERKPFGVAVHYRDAIDPDAARSAVMSAVQNSPTARQYAVREGARVVELVPPIGITKGSAIREVTQRFALNGLMYFGDDVTDADAFAAIHELRQEGRLFGVAVAAVHAETAREVLEAADITVPAVEGVCAVLESFVDRLSARLDRAAP